MIEHKKNQIYGTTILSVRKDGKAAIAGDGQVSFGNTKANIFQTSAGEPGDKFNGFEAQSWELEIP